MTTDIKLDFQLVRNASGQLVFTAADGTVHNGIYPVRAFPISAPEDGVSLFTSDGHELTWIENQNALPDEYKELIAQELVQREFMPVITRIKEVSSYATPSIWSIETNRGDTDLVLKAEDHIRRLANNSLLIADADSVYYLLHDVEKLDKQSRRILDRFL